MESVARTGRAVAIEPAARAGVVRARRVVDDAADAGQDSEVLVIARRGDEEEDVGERAAGAAEGDALAGDPECECRLAEDGGLWPARVQLRRTLRSPFRL